MCSVFVSEYCSVLPVFLCFFRGQVPAVAEENFLKKACTLDTYGVDPHPVKVNSTPLMCAGYITNPRNPQLFNLISLIQCPGIFLNFSYFS